jgi:hypothetical protein
MVNIFAAQSMWAKDTQLLIKKKGRKKKMKKEKPCSLPTEVYSRVVGYFRPVQNWNAGKKEEFKDRKVYIPQKND